MDQPIARESVLVQQADSSQIEVTIQIWPPHQDPERPGEWLCVTSLEPLYSKLGPARSDSAMQSLCLAVSHVFDLLHHEVEKGGSVKHLSGERFPFEAYSYGVLAGEHRQIK